MNTLSNISSFIKTQNPIQTIFWSGLIAGLLDAIAGVIVYFIWFKYNPFQVLQSISAGIYGPSVIGGGFIYVVLGLLLHFLIAFTAAGILFIAFGYIPALRKNALWLGILYGALIWIFMNLFVLPLSNYPKIPFDAGLAAVGIIWHMFLVGLPIGLITSWYYKKA